MEPNQPSPPAEPTGTKFKANKLPVELIAPDALLAVFDYDDSLEVEPLGKALKALLLWSCREPDGEHFLEHAASALMEHISNELSCDPLGAWLEVAKVLEFGAYKKPRADGTPGPNGTGFGYGERNWEQGLKWVDVYSAAVRHILKALRGEEKDDETGFPHPAHALCCVMFLIAYKERRMDQFDNRTVPVMGSARIAITLPVGVTHEEVTDITKQLYDEYERLIKAFRPETT